MTNTKTLAVVAVLMAATLVVGTFATVATTQSAFAYAKKPGHDDKKTRDNGSGNRNGNTVTALKCQNDGSASGFDTAVNQECENLICTHPGAGATCVSEGGNKTAGGGGTIDPCLNCFAILSADEQARFITAAVQSFGFNVKSIEDICRIIGTGTITVGQIAAVLQSANIPQSEGTHGALLIKCLLDAGLITNTDTT